MLLIDSLTTLADSDLDNLISMARRSGDFSLFDAVVSEIRQRMLVPFDQSQKSEAESSQSPPDCCNEAVVDSIEFQSNHRITNPPGILANKLEQLGIMTYRELELRCEELRQLPGFGRKCEDALTDLLQQTPASSEDNSGFASRPDSELLANLSFLSDECSGAFLWRPPRLIQEKLVSAGIETFPQLEANWLALTQRPGWGRESRNRLNAFVRVSHSLYLDTIPTAPTGFDLIDSLGKQVELFLTDKEPIVRELFVGRFLKQNETFSQIAERHGCSRELVRQLEDKWCLGALADHLLAVETRNAGGKVPIWSSMLAYLLRWVTKNRLAVHREIEDWIGNLLANPLDESRRAMLKAVFEILGIETFELSFAREKEIVFLAPCLPECEAAPVLRRVLTVLQERVLPCTREEILIELNRIEEISPWSTILGRFLDKSRFVEHERGLVGLTVRCLSSQPDRAARILWRRGEPMHFEEITKEIAASMGEHGEQGKDGSPALAKLHDELMVSIGKTGVWALRAWDVDARPLAERMVDAFRETGRPMTVDELLESVHLKEGGYPRLSIQTYLSMGYRGLFEGIGDAYYMLSEWRDKDSEAEDVGRYDKVQWHEQLQVILSEVPMTTRQIFNEFVRRFGRDDGIVNVDRRLHASPSLEKCKSDNVNLWSWVREYVAPVRNTYQLLVEREVLKLIQEGGENSIPLIEARDRLFEVHSVPHPTFYAAVSASALISKITDELGRIQLIDLRQQRNNE